MARTGTKTGTGPRSEEGGLCRQAGGSLVQALLPSLADLFGMVIQRASADCIGRGLAVIRVTHQADFVSSTLLPDRCSGTELIVMCSRALADDPLNNIHLIFCLNVLNNE